MMMKWLRFFRVVNLPTVPGDVLVGAGAAFAGGVSSVMAKGPAVFGAVLAALGLYLFGMADNDIAGAKTDTGRPIPDGLISLGAARLARGCCLAAVIVIGLIFGLPRLWWETALVLLIMIIFYNRTKHWLLMGLCRGLDVVCGMAAVGSALWIGFDWPGCLRMLMVIVWIVYIAGVTKYSEGEETDPKRRRLVGVLIGAHVYLQLFALLGCYLIAPQALTRVFLLAGAALLIVLRLMKRFLPEVSAS